jgi:glyoxylate/hydroxypyruvate reductase A
MAIMIAIRGQDAEPWVKCFTERLPNHSIVLEGSHTQPELVRFGVSWQHEPGSLARYKNLAAIFSLGAGVDHILADPKLPSVPIVRSTNPDLSNRMSEWVLLHVLAHLRQYRKYDRQQSQKVWKDDRSQPSAEEIHVGVMGLGMLGLNAANKLKMVGFDVAGWSRTPKNIPGIECFSGSTDLEHFLARTDILVCLLPLTPETKGILNKRLFLQLRQGGPLSGPILLNAGRGELQSEDDIITSLDEGILRATTLDVFEIEPLSTDSPLWLHPAVTITPHNAAMSDPSAIVAEIAKQIEAYERGEPLQNVVKHTIGY